MKEQIKFVLALGAVLLLLPCVLTVFLSGRGAVSFSGRKIWKDMWRREPVWRFLFPERRR